MPVAIARLICMAQECTFVVDISFDISPPLEKNDLKLTFLYFNSGGSLP
jgi:hypothetical protein